MDIGLDLEKIIFLVIGVILIALVIHQYWNERPGVADDKVLINRGDLPYQTK